MTTTSSPNVLIDRLFAQTWLLLAQLARNTPISDGQHCYAYACQLVSATEQKLTAHFSTEQVQQLLYIQCAALDQLVLSRKTDDPAYQVWINTPLQTHFFHSLQAGDTFWQQLNQALQQTPGDLALLTCYQRVIALAFPLAQQNSEQQALSQQLQQRLAEQIAPCSLASNLTRRLAAIPSRYYHYLLFLLCSAVMLWAVSYILLKTMLAAR